MWRDESGSARKWHSSSTGKVVLRCACSVTAGKKEKKRKTRWCGAVFPELGNPPGPTEEQTPLTLPSAVLDALCILLISASRLKVKPRTEIAIHWEEKAEGVFWASSKIIRLRGNYFDFVKSEWTAKGSRHRILSGVNPPARSVLSYCRVRGA